MIILEFLYTSSNFPVSFKDYQYFVDFRPKKKKKKIIKAKQIDRNVMLVIDYMSGWICSISFSQN